MASATPIAGQSRPAMPPVVQPSSGNAIIINPCQRLNPMLECIRNVNKEFGDIVPDFQLGRTTCALFLSLKYHRLHPEYIHQRIQKLGQLYALRLLMLMCDVSEHQEPIRELTKICIVNNITIIVCWSNEEAGMYLATYKAFEHKPPDLIKERPDKEYGAMLRTALTSISKVNKTDVETLRTTFGSFAKIARATPEELRRLPGFGQVKVRRVVDAFDKPFRNKATSALPAQTQARTQADLQLHGGIEIEESEDDHGSLGDEARRLVKDDTVTQNRESNQRTTQSTATSFSSAPTSSTNRVHNFGSTADIPTLLRPTSSSSEQRRVREPSPIWDIELDLNLPEDESEGEEVDPRLAKKGNKATEDKEQERQAQRKGNTESDVQGPTPGHRSPSLVWDIELDLNDDD